MQLQQTGVDPDEESVEACHRTRQSGFETSGLRLTHVPEADGAVGGGREAKGAIVVQQDCPATRPLVKSRGLKRSAVIMPVASQTLCCHAIAPGFGATPSPFVWCSISGYLRIESDGLRLGDTLCVHSTVWDDCHS